MSLNNKAAGQVWGYKLLGRFGVMIIEANEG